MVDGWIAGGGAKAAVDTVWNDRARMWFVEVRPERERAAPVSIGVEGDTLMINAGGSDVEMWGREGELPYDALRNLMAEVVAGRVPRRSLRRRRSYEPY